MGHETKQCHKLGMSRLCLIVSLALLCLTMCNNQVSSNPFAQPTDVIVITGEPCTLLGCHDELSVHINGDLPDDYFIEMDDAEGKVVTVQCFWDDRATLESEWPMSSVYTNQSYELSSPELEKISPVSSTLKLCDSNIGHVGHTIGVFPGENDSFVEWVVIQCFEPETVLLQSKCVPEGVQVYGFVPEKLSLTIRWNGNAKTVTLYPSYTISRPNGPHCEPECRWADIEIDLP